MSYLLLLGVANADTNLAHGITLSVGDNARIIKQNGRAWLFLDGDDVMRFVSGESQREGAIERLKNGAIETVFHSKDGRISYYHRKSTPARLIFRLVPRSHRLYEVLKATQSTPLNSCIIIKRQPLSLHANSEILIELDGEVKNKNKEAHGGADSELFLECELE